MTVEYELSSGLGSCLRGIICIFFFFQAEDGIRDLTVTGVLTCALPIWLGSDAGMSRAAAIASPHRFACRYARASRSEEHTSELQSQSNIVCRLLLERKKIVTIRTCWRSASAA